MTGGGGTVLLAYNTAGLLNYVHNQTEVIQNVVSENTGVTEISLAT